MGKLDFAGLFLLVGTLGVVAGVLVGIESSTRPENGMRRYQRIMRRFNWDVKPIDKKLELNSTRRLGVVLFLLSLLLAGLLVRVASLNCS